MQSMADRPASVPLHLDDATIARSISTDEAREAVWSAFAAWGRGDAATTQRVRASVNGADGAIAGMASAMAAVVMPYCGGKLYATTNGVFTFVNVLFHVDGRFLATLDGDVITRLRTPPASALAVHHLATPDAARAAVIGTGRQSWTHLQMLAESMPDLTEVRINGYVREEAVALVARAQEHGIPAVLCESAPEAVDGAQVIVTITSSREPLFPAEVVADDALICAIGATKYDRVEIGADVVARCATVVCDDVVGSRVECGDLIAAAAAGTFDWADAIELHAVAAGTVVPERAGAAPVLFETQGVAIQDVALAAIAWERATGLRPPLPES
jgi:ornithine cyclodeaminase/alanine dehydrogenase-like protein (mu-crystallin family)